MIKVVDQLLLTDSRQRTRYYAPLAFAIIRTRNHWTKQELYPIDIFLSDPLVHEHLQKSRAKQAPLMTMEGNKRADWARRANR